MKDLTVCIEIHTTLPESTVKSMIQFLTLPKWGKGNLVRSCDNRTGSVVGISTAQEFKSR